MDEALILEGIDLSGADAAFLDMDAICTAGFFELFLNEPYDIIERWLYEDSCSIEVWSDGSYYHGNFLNGVKEGDGVYFWADGSKYTGQWHSDEMSG